MQKIMWFMLSLLMAAVPNAPACAFTLSFGGTTGPGGVTNQGTFSNVANTSFTTTTIDFNSVALSSGSFTSGIATYSTTTDTGAIRTDGFAPSYTPGTTPSGGGTANTSAYLAVFNTVTVNFSRSLDYFGLDWGFTDSNNTVAFYQGNTLLRTYSALDAFGSVNGNNGSNAYVNFFAQNSSEYFNKIVFTESGGGGFETDNHAYRQAVDEPYPLPVLVGLMALGLVVKRRVRPSTY